MTYSIQEVQAQSNLAPQEGLSFANKEEALDYTDRVQREINDIDYQIKDYMQLIQMSKDLPMQIEDSDPNWIKRAMDARRIRQLNLDAANQWLARNGVKSNSPQVSEPKQDSKLSAQLTLLYKRIDKQADQIQRLQTACNSLQSQIEQEKAKRVALSERFSGWRALTARGLWQLNELREEQISFIKEQLAWVPDQIKRRSDWGVPKDKK